MCKCAELDWTNVDQTKDHHPDCARTKGGVAVNPYPFEKDSVEFFIQRSETSVAIGGSFPMHTGFGVVEMVDDTHTLEECKESCACVIAVSELTAKMDRMMAMLERLNSVPVESVILRAIKDNPGAVASAVAKSFDRRDKASDIIKDRVNQR